MVEARVRGLSVGRLAEGGPYPIAVYAGQSVRVYKAVMEYQGPSGTLYLHWGLKAAYADFNNGANLEAGAFAWASFTVPTAPAWQQVTALISADLLISTAMRTGRVYDTYVWVAKIANTALETQILVIDTDSSVVEIVAPVQAVRNLQVAYAKV